MASAFVAQCIRSASISAAPKREEFLFDLAVFLVPFVVFVFQILAVARWGETVRESPAPTWRNRIVLVGTILGVASGGLLLSLWPLFMFMIFHESLIGVWIFSGGTLAILAAACGVFGLPGLRRPALVSVLLPPFWALIAGLLMKAAID